VFTRPGFRTALHALRVAVIPSCIILVGYELSVSARRVRAIADVHRGSFRAEPSQQFRRNELPPLSVFDASGREVSLDLRRKNAVLLFYDTHCGPCAANVSRWIDLLLELRSAGRAADVIAVSFEEPRVGVEYWGALARTVRIVQPADREDFTRHFPPIGTPTTMLVRNGALVAVQGGTMGPARREFLIRQLGN
jgi:hypothetical protein